MPNTISGKTKLEYKCECGFAFKTSGNPKNCPKCNKELSKEQIQRRKR